MRASVLVVLFLGVCFAYDAPVAYSGSTVGSAAFNFPTFNSVSRDVCTASATQAPYVSFPLNVTSAGVRSIQVMAEQSFKSEVQVYLYTTFTAATPCTGLFLNRLLEKKSPLSGGPVLDDVVYFPVGVYTVVVSADSVNASGIFAIQITAPMFSGAFSPATVWSAAYDDDGECADYSSGIPFGSMNFTINVTGEYDIIVAVSNETNDFSYSYISIYSGVVSAAQLSNNSCPNSFLDGTYTSSDITGLYNISITNGTSYTIAVSGNEDDDLGYWGVWVRPTQVRTLSASPAFAQPDRSVDNGTCVDGTNDQTSWWALQFKAIGQVTVIDTSSPPSEFTYVDTYSFFYYGNNAGNATVAPTTCPVGKPLIVMGDTGDVTPVYGVTVPGLNYTVVVSTYNGGDSEGSFILYAFTGKPLGTIPAPVTTTGAVMTEGTEHTHSHDEGSVATAAQVMIALIFAALALVF